MTVPALPTAAGLDAVLARHLHPVVHSGHASGVVVAAIQDGTRAVAYLGTHARTGGRPVGPDTRFELGSLTKSYTGLLLLELVARGAVGLDDPVAGYLPPAAVPRRAAARRITLRHLATHTSGLPRVPLAVLRARPGTWLTDPYARYDLADLYRTTRRMRPWSEPGRRTRYSTLGVGLLGQALANAAGTGYPDLLADRITGPLGMPATHRGSTDADATGHRRGRPVPPWRFQALAGAGGLRTSGPDALRYLDAHLYPEAHLDRGHGSLAEALAAVRRPPYPGWQHHPGQVHTVLWHSGGTGGFTAFTGFSLDRAVGVVVLANAYVTRRRPTIVAARRLLTELLSTGW